jgi:hypothetical protein
VVPHFESVLVGYGVSQKPNPYEHMAKILGKLSRLAGNKMQIQTTPNSRKPNRDLGEQWNLHNQNWESSKDVARKISIERGIPFSSFDPVLNDASQAWQTLLHIAAGDVEDPLLRIPEFLKIERRLKELSLTLGGSKQMLSTPLDYAEDDWITVTVASEFSGINTGVISRAASAGEIKTNGEIRKATAARWQFHALAESQRQRGRRERRSGSEVNGQTLQISLAQE